MMLLDHLPPLHYKPSRFAGYECTWFLRDPQQCTPCLALMDSPITFSILGIVVNPHFTRPNGTPRHHFSLDVEPLDPEDLRALRNSLPAYANPPTSKSASFSHT